MADNEPRVVFLTGAGLSADSGVQTFRGEGGYYDGISARELLSWMNLMQSPQVVHAFLDEMRINMRDAQPNEAHKMIARLGNEFGDRVVHLTQNIDPLVEMAGYADTVHLHGFITRLRSIRDSEVTEDIGFTRYWDGDPSDAPPRGFKFRCLKTGGIMRPDVVLFGEMAPEYVKMDSAMRTLRPQDTLVVIGTQGNVLPVEKFASQTSSMTVLNNLHSSPDIRVSFFDHVFMDPAAHVAGEIEKLVRNCLAARNKENSNARER